MLKRIAWLVPLLAGPGCSGDMLGSSAEDARYGGAPNAQGAANPSSSGGLGGGGPVVVAPAASASPPLPPEEELSLEFELPHAGERYVYAVNPESDSVAVIDANTLAIHGVEAGDQPTFLQTLAGRDAAIVLNVRSSDATLIRTADGQSQVLSVPVQSGANAIAVAPDGNHAVVYFNSSYRGAGASGSFQDISVLFLEEGKERAEAMTVGFRPSSVAFSADGTRAFVVTEDGVSLLDFAQIESEGPAIARTVPLGDDATASLDVSVTPDGKYALARREGDSELRLVNLETSQLMLLDLAKELATVSDPIVELDAGPLLLVGDAALADASGSDSAVSDAEAEPQMSDAAVIATDAGVGDATDEAVVDAETPLTDGATSATTTATGTAVPSAAVPSAAVPSAAATGVPAPLPAAITDVDLAPSGDFALAVVRDQSTVLRVDIPGAFEAPESYKVRKIKIGTELVGSVSIAANSERALLYSTVVDTLERVSILDIEKEEYSPVRLPKSVESVTIAGNSTTALIVHQKLAGNPDERDLDPDTALDRSYGYSVMDLASGFSKLQTTRTNVGPSSIVPDGSNLFVLFNDAALSIREVHQVNLQSFVVRNRALGSPPTSLGSVPGSKKVFVGQDHPDGRITFIDWVTGSIESVTGFELNSRIRE